MWQSGIDASAGLIRPATAGKSNTTWYRWRRARLALPDMDVSRTETVESLIARYPHIPCGGGASRRTSCAQVWPSTTRR